METKTDVKAILKRSKELIEEGKKYLADQGIEYDLGKWLTIKNYADKYGLKSTNVVSNWISRGTIPPENVVRIEELNGIVLVKDIPYGER